MTPLIIIFGNLNKWTVIVYEFSYRYIAVVSRVFYSNHKLGVFYLEVNC